jgi:carotenoid cleavage dioxygenase-like enzyme
MASPTASLFSDGREAPPTPLATLGALPAWLRGSLFVNGPGKFADFHHLFDGFALLHKFTLRPSGVTYSARFLRSAAYSAAEARGGAPQCREFASQPGGLLGRLRTLAAGSAASDNANVALVALRGALYAVTEAPGAWRVRKRDLATVAPWRGAPALAHAAPRQVAVITSAHVAQHAGGLPGVHGGAPFAVALSTRFALALPPALVAAATSWRCSL